MVEVRQKKTGRGWSWLRSGREHWAGILAVEVRQGTLTWMVVVEVRQGTLTWIAVEQEEEDDEEERRRRGGGGGAGRGRRQLT